ncbi:MAG: tRNA (adenosine(37)-N6)-threonylcarbamoyltransferase complex dimerization subunit type 1 TsaB, partial [bacterium]
MLLVFDTSLADESMVALADEEGKERYGTRVYPRKEGGSAYLLRGARELLGVRGAGLEALTGLVVSRGPGSYTGLRIGFSLAQGLSEARSLPVVSVPSFDAFAAGHREPGLPLVVCYDARSRGVAFVIFPAGSAEAITAGSEEERKAAASAV